MASGDPVQVLVLSCLERVESLLADLDRLAAAPAGHHEWARVRANIRRELQAAEAAIRGDSATPARPREASRKHRQRG